MTCIILVRAKGDTVGSIVAPAVPGGWLVTTEFRGSGVDWLTLWPGGAKRPGAPRLMARMLIDGADLGQPTRAVWQLCTGPDGRGGARLQEIAAASNNAWTIRQLRADNGAVATAVKAAWRDERPRDGGNVIPDYAGTTLVAIRRVVAGSRAQDAEVPGTIDDIPDGAAEIVRSALRRRP